jgi:predicted DNA-binding WGR domain protein
MRTFQHSDAKSHKFGNIAVSDNRLTVTFGDVGAEGQITCSRATSSSPRRRFAWVIAGLLRRSWNAVWT